MTGHMEEGVSASLCSSLVPLDDEIDVLNNEQGQELKLLSPKIKPADFLSTSSKSDHTAET